MGLIIFVIALAVFLVNLGCWIYTVIVAFQNEDAIIGILCLCPLVAFVMGFIKMKEWNHTNIMIVWSICFVINLLLEGINRAI